MRRALLATLLPAVLALAGTGCGVKTEPMGSRADHYPVGAGDATGRVVTVPRQPTRIAATDPAAAVVLHALRPPARVTTATAGDGRGVSRPRPDLVVAPAAAERASTATPRGVPVFRYGVDRFEDMVPLVAHLGLVVGRGPEGVDLARRVAAGLARARADGRAARPVRVFLDAGALQTLGPPGPLPQAVRLAGGRLISTTTRPVTITELQRFDPQVWLVLPASGSTLSALRHSAETRRLAAVRRGRVYAVREEDFGATPDLPRRLEALIRLLHPAS